MFKYKLQPNNTNNQTKNRLLSELLQKCAFSKTSDSCNNFYERMCVRFSDVSAKCTCPSTCLDAFPQCSRVKYKGDI